MEKVSGRTDGNTRQPCWSGQEGVALAAVRVPVESLQRPETSPLVLVGRSCGQTTPPRETINCSTVLRDSPAS